MLVCKTGDIQPGDLPESIRDEMPSVEEFTIPPQRTLAEIEKVAIVQTLMRTNWNKQEAAQILGLYRPTLYSKMKKHQILDQRAKPRTVPAGGAARHTTNRTARKACRLVTWPAASASASVPVAGR